MRLHKLFCLFSFIPAAFVVTSIVSCGNSNHSDEYELTSTFSKLDQNNNTTTLSVVSASGEAPANLHWSISPAITYPLSFNAPDNMPAVFTLQKNKQMNMQSYKVSATFGDNITLSKYIEVDPFVVTYSLSTVSGPAALNYATRELFLKGDCDDTDVTVTDISSTVTLPDYLNFTYDAQTKLGHLVLSSDEWESGVYHFRATFSDAHTTDCAVIVSSYSTAYSLVSDIPTIDQVNNVATLTAIATDPLLTLNDIVVSGTSLPSHLTLSRVGDTNQYTLTLTTGTLILGDIYQFVATFSDAHTADCFVAVAPFSGASYSLTPDQSVLDQGKNTATMTAATTGTATVDRIVPKQEIDSPLNFSYSSGPTATFTLTPGQAVAGRNYMFEVEFSDAQTAACTITVTQFNGFYYTLTSNFSTIDQSNNVATITAATDDDTGVTLSSITSNDSVTSPLNFSYSSGPTATFTLTPGQTIAGRTYTFTATFSNGLTTNCAIYVTEYTASLPVTSISLSYPHDYNLYIKNTVSSPFVPTVIDNLSSPVTGVSYSTSGTLPTGLVFNAGQFSGTVTAECSNLIVTVTATGSGIWAGLQSTFKIHFNCVSEALTTYDFSENTLSNTIAALGSKTIDDAYNFTSFPYSSTPTDSKMLAQVNNMLHWDCTILKRLMLLHVLYNWAQLSDVAGYVQIALTWQTSTVEYEIYTGASGVISQGMSAYNFNSIGTSSTGNGGTNYSIQDPFNHGNITWGVPSSSSYWIYGIESNFPNIKFPNK